MKLVFIIVIVIVAIIFYRHVIYTENFTQESDTYNFCPNCQSNTPKEQCMSCSNCGWCEDDQGQGTCIRGDPSSPFFTDKCLLWQHRDKLELEKENNGKNPFDRGYEFSYGDRVLQHRTYATLNHNDQ